MTTNEFKIRHQGCTLRVQNEQHVNPEHSVVILRCDYHGEEVTDRVSYGLFCHRKVECVGRGSCPREYSCCD